jgi:hypothetical protein
MSKKFACPVFFETILTLIKTVPAALGTVSSNDPVIPDGDEVFFLNKMGGRTGYFQLPDR